MSTNKQIRIGVIACADIAFRAVIPAINKIDELKLIAVASRSKDKAEKFANHFSCEAIIGYQNLIDRKDIDAIYIPLPTGLHEEWVIKSLNAGKHVFVEKSFSLNISSCRKMINLAIKNKLLILENFMFQYHRQHLIAKQLILDGKIGEIKLFKSSFCFKLNNVDDFRFDKKLGGGALLDAGCYTLKASRFYLGDEIKKISSNLIFKNGVDVSGGVQVLYNSGVISQLFFGFDSFYQCNIEIIGTSGKISLNKSFTPKPDFKPTLILEKESEVNEIVVDSDNHFVNILKYFVNTIFSKDFSHEYENLLNQAKFINLVKNSNNTNICND